MIEKLPAGQVPLDSEIEGADDTTVTLNAGGGELQKNVNASAGLSEEDFKKYAS